MTTSPLDWIRPQPIGLEPWPVGGLLLPAVEGAEGYARALVAGTTAAAPDGLAFHAAARRDDLDAARALLDGAADPIARYDAFVLDPSAEALAALRADFAATDARLAELLEVAAFVHGLADRPPAFAALDGELLAAALAAVASAALEAGDLGPALATLERAVDAARIPSPALAAQLLLSCVEIDRDTGAAAEAIAARLESALQTLGADGHAVLRAEIRLELGVHLQQTAATVPGGLDRAIVHLQDALRDLGPSTHRRAHGFAQMRLGLCYLARRTDSASDGLRLGIAAQALDKAVTILDPQREPDLWAPAAINLANLFQMIPSNQFAEKLERALSLYERVLAIRDVDRDPLGHARTQLNRAQAAAALERFDVAASSLRTARDLFGRLGMAAERDHASAQLASVEADVRERALTPESGA